MKTKVNVCWLILLWGSTLALDLLRWTLAFDPAKRITVNEALSHPYLAAWHREDDEVPSAQPQNGNPYH